MSEWKIVKFSQLAKGHRGVSYKPHQLLSHYTENVTILLRSNNIKNSKLNFDELQFVLSDIVSDTQRCRQNDIVMCMSNGSRHLVGKNAFVSQTNGQNYTCGAFCSLFRTEDGQIPGFIFSLLQSQFFQKQLDITLSGSAINNLQNSQVENFDFFIPSSLELQRKIAKILTTCDTVIEQTQSTIAKYKAIKQGMLHDLFTCGLDANGKLRPTYQQAPELYKESELGMIPKEWEVKRLEGIGEVVTGSTPSTLVAANYADKYQFISPADINGQQYILKSDKMLSEIGFSLSRRIPANSICVVCIGSTIGKSAMTSVNCCTNQQINAIVPFEKEVGLFYYYATKEYLTKQFAANMGLQAVPIVNKSTFQKFIIPFPNDQVEAVLIQNKLISIDNKIHSEETLLSKYQSIKRGLMGDLLGGRKEV
jgi:type I restriction enzyme S subunit